jgi:hypothetical protein
MSDHSPPAAIPAESCQRAVVAALRAWTKNAAAPSHRPLQHLPRIEAPDRSALGELTMASAFVALRCVR